MYFPNPTYNLTNLQPELLFRPAGDRIQRDVQLFGQIGPAAEGWHGGENWTLCLATKHRNDLRRAIAGNDRFRCESGYLGDVLLMCLCVVGIVSKNFAELFVNH